MKNIKFLFLALLLISGILVSCNKEEDGSFVKPITLYEKVAGTWTLSSVNQVDELRKSASIKPFEMDLTSALNFASLKLVLTVDESSAPTTYAVTGSAPALFPISGYWKLDNEFPLTNGTPVMLLLYSDAAKTVQTAKFAILTMPGALPQIELKLTRTTKQVAYISYDYKFSGAAAK